MLERMKNIKATKQHIQLDTMNILNTEKSYTRICFHEIFICGTREHTYHVIRCWKHAAEACSSYRKAQSMTSRHTLTYPHIVFPSTTPLTL